MTLTRSPGVGTLWRALNRPLGALKSFKGERRGIAAVEFALVLPLMLLMYVGTYDISQMIMVSHKAKAASGTISELVAEQATGTQVSTATISDILAAGGATMAPFSANALTMTVSAIDLKPNTDGTCCIATVNWSYTQGGTLRPCSQPLVQTDPGAAASPTTIPKAIATRSASVQAALNINSVIIADVTYPYNPLSPGIDHLSSRSFAYTSYDLPRSSGQVLLNNPVNPPSGQSGTVC